MPPKKSKKGGGEPAVATSGSVKDLTGDALKKLRAAEKLAYDRAQLPIKMNELRERKKKALSELFDVQNDIKTQKEDQNDVYFFLHKKLDDNYDIISALEHQLLSEELERKASEEKYEEELEKDRKTFEAEEAVLKEKLRDVDEKLYGLKDVNGYKQETEQEMSTLLREIEEERAAHYKAMAELERSAIKKKEVLKQRLLMDMKEAKLVLTDEVRTPCNVAAASSAAISNINMLNTSFFATRFARCRRSAPSRG